MAAGPGKYDDLTTLVRNASDALAVVVIVAGGNRGSGFDVQVAGVTPEEGAEVTRKLAALMRTVAEQMEADSERIQRGEAGFQTKFEPGSKV
jgi:hypothetical protein